VSLDPLEQRLTHIELETPDPGRVSARVLTLRPKARRVSVFRVPAVGLGTIALALAVLYFVPAAAAALAGVPGGGDLLREAGLAGAAGKVTTVGAVAESSGYRITLVGAYADSERTVLLLRTSPSATPDFATMRLTDQFGRSYPMQSGSSDGRTGDLILQFDPLGWPDGTTGARVTLRLNSVHRFAYDSAARDWRNGPPVAGTWTLQASIGIDEAVTLATPSAGQLGGVTCTFGAARASAATIVIDVYMHGVTPDQLEQRIPDGGKGLPVFQLLLIDPTGDVVTQSYGLSPASQTSDGTVIHLVGFRSVPGNYTVRVVYQGVELDRVLRVP